MLSPISRISAIASGLSLCSAGSAASSARLSSIGRAPSPASWIRVGDHGAHRVVAQVPLAGELHRRQPRGLGDRAHPLQPLTAPLDPAVGPERAVIAVGQLGARQHVVPEEPAVVDDPGDHPDVRADGGVEGQLPRPRLQRVQDQHRPVDALAEALEAADQVQREAVRGPGRDPELRGQAGLAQRLHAVPDVFALVPGAVGVVQQQQVEGVLAEALEAALGRHPQVGGVGIRTPQGRIREPRKPARPGSRALVEVVADRADQGVGIARSPVQGPAQELVGLALAVGVGAEDRLDALARAQQRLEPRPLDRLPEVQEAARRSRCR